MPRDQGHPAASPTTRFERRADGRLVAGVASGLADRLHADVALVRLGFVVSTLIGGLGVPIYAACWLLVPQVGEDHAIAAELLGSEGFWKMGKDDMTHPRGDHRYRDPWHPPTTMRVSDAERTVVADALERHCAAGRLDMVEFEHRLERALTAKTEADLVGLLDDLPQGPETRRRPQRRRRGPAGTLYAVAIIGSLWLVSSMTVPHVPWLQVVLLLGLFWFLQHRRFRDGRAQWTRRS